MSRAAIAAIWLCLVLGATNAMGATPPALLVYGAHAAIDHVALSPSGDRYAYLAAADGRDQIFVQPVDKSPPLALDVGERTVTDIQWAGNDHLIAFVRVLVRLDRGFSVPELWSNMAIVYNIRTMHSFTVFSGKDSQVSPINQQYYGTREFDGHRYGYFAGLDQSRLPGNVFVGTTQQSLYRVDLDSGDVKLVAHGYDGGEARWLVGPTGDVLVRYEYDWATGKWRVLSGAAGGNVIVAGQDSWGAGGLLAFGRTPDELLFQHPSDLSGLLTSMTLSLSSGALAAIPDHDGADLVSLDEDNHWIGMKMGGDQPVRRYFDPKAQANLDKVYQAFGSHFVTIESHNASFTEFIALASSAEDSGTYYLVNLSTLRAEPIGYAFPTIEPDGVYPIKMFDYVAADGAQLHGVLTLPSAHAAGSLPLVVISHGDGGERDFPRFSPLAQALASRGYAVLQPNTRGSGGYGGAFMNAGLGEFGGKVQTDISDGVASLARQGLIDPNRVCIVGDGFFAGYSALAGVTLQHGLYRCAVATDGFYDLSLAIQDMKRRFGDTSNWVRYFKGLVGARSWSGSDIAAISPINLAAHADAPVLLIYNSVDPDNQARQTELMADALRHAGKSVETVPLPTSSGEAASAANNLRKLQATIAFIEGHNPPDTPPPAADAQAPPVTQAGSNETQQQTRVELRHPGEPPPGPLR